MSTVTTARQADSSSEAEFSGFSDAEAVPKQRQYGMQQKSAATLVINPEDEELEDLVFGRKTSWLDNRTDNSQGIGALVDAITGQEVAVRWDKEDDVDGDNIEEIDDAYLFAFDNDVPTGAIVPTDPIGDGIKETPDGAAWYDSDDDRVTVSLASRNMLRKLRKFETEDNITGREYSIRLAEQYSHLHAEPKWAKDAKAKTLAQKVAEENGERPAKRRRSSAGSGDGGSSDDEENSSTLPLSDFLRDIRNMQPTSTKRRTFRPETLDIQRSRDLAGIYSGPVTSLQFHPSLPTILMSSSKSSLLKIHKIDPIAHPTPNPTIATVQVARTPILRAAFAGADGESIIMAGRRRYMHTWNLATGNVAKTTKISGNITKLDHKTFENFRPSPCGRYVALLGSSRKGGGTIFILSAQTMMWNAEARMESRGGVADFVWWRDGEGLTVLGRDGSVGEYSMMHRMFASMWTDEGNIGGMVLALGGSDGPELLGTDRWLAIGDKTGFVHIYDRNVVFSKVTKGDGEVVVEVSNGGKPSPLKRMENLTSRVTTLRFSPDGQLLVMASVDQKDALKIAHLPTCTYYRNWPTEETPLGRVTDVAISKTGFLAVGNDVGKIRLFEIRK